MRRWMLRWSAGMAVAAGLVIPAASVAATASAAATSPTCPAGQPTGAAPGQTSPNSPGRPSTYPMGQCQLLLSSGVIPAGGTVVVTGSGFSSYTKVALTMSPYGTNLGTATADSTGGFTTSVSIPASTTPGTYTIVATGGGQSESAVLQVTTPAATTSNQTSGGQTVAEAGGTGSSGSTASPTGGSGSPTSGSGTASGGSSTPAPPTGAAGSTTTTSPTPGSGHATGPTGPSSPATIAHPGGGSPLAWIIAGLAALIVAAGAALVMWRRRGTATS